MFFKSESAEYVRPLPDSEQVQVNKGSPWTNPRIAAHRCRSVPTVAYLGISCPLFTQGTNLGKGRWLSQIRGLHLFIRAQHSHPKLRACNLAVHTGLTDGRADLLTWQADIRRKYRVRAGGLKVCGADLDSNPGYKEGGVRGGGTGSAKAQNWEFLVYDGSGCILDRSEDCYDRMSA